MVPLPDAGRGPGGPSDVGRDDETRKTVWVALAAQACASILIGVLLVYVAYMLGRAAHVQRVGEAADPGIQRQVRDFLTQQPEIDMVTALLTMRLGRSGNPPGRRRRAPLMPSGVARRLEAGGARSEEVVGLAGHSLGGWQQPRHVLQDRARLGKGLLVLMAGPQTERVGRIV
ncbi:hypothetical protein ACIA98_16425 [Streptomyces sp. NPDC051366]|uniref:hypothetical protein n=1 Tax=Streptomyces sp. NPDC051366 TaxID=3365652 RepID=UPI00378B4651